MRIALVNNFFLPRASGSAHLTDGLARELSAAGHDVLVITTGTRETAGEEERSGYRIVRLPSWSLPRMKLSMNYDVAFTVSPANVRRLFRTLDEFAPDVVHQHGQFFDLTWTSAIWARRRRVPTVLTVHTALVHTVTLFRAILWVADMVLVRPFLAIGRPAVVTIDWFIDSYVRRRYRLPDDRIVAIPIGVDPERFEQVDPGARARVRERLGIGDRPMILSVGHVIPLRDRLLPVRALPHVLERRPDAALVVVGKVYDDRFLQLAAELGVTDHLLVTGEVARDDMPEYVAAADVEGHDFQNYGLGTASLEVMAAGIPVVSVVRTDNFPGIELRSWENVVIVPPDDAPALADAVVRLLDEPETRERLAGAERALIREHFSIAAVAEQHLALYEKLQRR